MESVHPELLDLLVPRVRSRHVHVWLVARALGWRPQESPPTEACCYKCQVERRGAALRCPLA